MSRNKIFIAVGIILLIVAGTIFLLNNSLSDEETIDKAIKDKNPALCEKIKQTTMPGPTDGPVVVSGQHAVDFCKQEVRQGSRIIGG